MEKKLKQMFDYQAFSGNKEIDRMMKEAETRYGSALSDDDLFFVNAAGTDIDLDREKKDQKDDDRLL